MGVLKNTWRHIRRSPYQALAAVSIMSLTFIVTGMFVLISLGSAKVLQIFEQRPQIIVFFKDVKKESDIQALVDRLEKMESVASVNYVSKEKALSIYKEQYKNDPLLLEMVSADILPASIEVSAVKIEQLSELAKMFEQEGDIEEIVYHKDLVDFLAAWTNTVRYVGLTVVIFLLLVALINVVTVIAMKIALKKEEIEILQLVGASSWYIRMPFLTEGMIYGLVGAIIGAGLNIALLIYSSAYLSALFVGIPLFPISWVVYLVFLASMAAVGVILGFVASTLAINRYLR